MTPHSFLAQTPNRKPDERDKTKVVDQGKGQQSPAAKDVVLGYLESRDRIVTLLRGTKGTIYTIKTKDGKTLATKLQEKDFQAQYPQLYDQIKYGVAGNDATLRWLSGKPVQTPPR
jgi:hypothetical protein